MVKDIALLVSITAVLSGCAVLDRLKSQDKAQAPAPVAATQALPGMAPAQTAATLDQTTEAERAAALAAPVAGARALGAVTVALGSPVEQGFWLKSALVTSPGKGKVETAAGASVAVDLLPGDGGALLSLAAYRALGLSLTDLPEVTVYAQ